MVMRALSRLLVCATLVAVVPAAAFSDAAAQTRAPTAEEKAAIDRANTAIRAKDYATARTILTSPELAQSASAKIALFQIYTEGLGGPKDPAAASAALRRAAELGDSRAMYNLAIDLGAAGTPAALAEAKSWYIQAADLGLYQARLQLGRMQWADGNHAAAVEQWKRIEKQPSAQMCLGMAQATGQGMPADMVAANHKFFKLFREPIRESIACVATAATAGSAEAQFLMGLWHANKGTPGFDAAKAIKQLTAAADQRHVRATAYLAELYDEGTLVPRDAKAAYSYYLQAAENDPLHYGRLGEMALKGDGTERNVANAVSYWLKDEYGVHNYQLGLIYAGAEGWPPDLPKAIAAMQIVDEEDDVPKALAWMRALADKGNAQAQLAFAEMLDDYDADADPMGLGPKDDPDAVEEKAEALAISYFRRAAQQKLPAAMYALTQNDDLSDAEEVRLLRAAAGADYAPAMLELAEKHMMGWSGLAKDDVAKRAWEERAARTGDPYTLRNLGAQYVMAGAISTNFIGREAGAEERTVAYYRLAARYYEAAFAAGSTSAAAPLALLYDQPRRPALDNPALAFKWAQEAMKHDPSGETMRVLSVLYEKGRGTAPDPLKAWFWQRVAHGDDTKANPRLDTLWQKLSPGLRANGERAMMVCEMKRWKGCSI